MKRLTAGNLEVAHSPGGVSIASRQQFPQPRKNIRAFTVRYDAGAQEVVIAKGYIAALKICPDKRLIIPKLPQINEGESGMIDEFGSLRFSAAEFTPEESYDVVAIINADDAKGNFLSIRESSEDEEDEEIEDCQRIFKIATFTLSSVGGEITLEKEHLNQIWESDIIMPWEDLSDECCSRDGSDDGSDDEDGSSGPSESDSSDSDGNPEDPDSTSGSDGALCPCPDLSTSGHVVGVGQEMELCFTTGLIEDVLIKVFVTLPETPIACPDTFGDTLSVTLVCWFTNAAQEWGNASQVRTRLQVPLRFNRINPEPNIETFVTIPAQCGQWKTLRTRVYMASRMGMQAYQKTCVYPDIHIKMPGLIVVGEYCSSCTDDSDGSFEA